MGEGMSGSRNRHPTYFIPSWLLSDLAQRILNALHLSKVTKKRQATVSFDASKAFGGWSGNLSRERSAK